MGMSTGALYRMMQRGLKSIGLAGTKISRRADAIAGDREFLALMNQPQSRTISLAAARRTLVSDTLAQQVRSERHARPDPNRSRLMKSSITQPPARRRHNQQNNHSRLHLMPKYGN
jgi:hypothetical protein